MRYIANDGKIFDTERECREHEQTLCTFLDGNGDICSATDEVFFIHTDCPLPDFGVDKGDWVWDEPSGEWVDIDDHINFLQGIAEYFESMAR